MINRVEAYLDRLFDLLSHTGAAGRRVLLESHAHLDEAVAANRAQGMSQEAAEGEAIARFGTPETIAGAHFAARTLPLSAALGRVIAAAWLMAGASGLAFGLMGVIDAVMVAWLGPSFTAGDAPINQERVAGCVGANIVGANDWCHPALIAHHTRELIDQPLVAGAVGLMALLLFAIARRTPTLRGFTTLPHASMVATAGAVAFAGGGAVVLISGLVGLMSGARAEVGQHLAEGLGAIAVGLMFVPGAWRAARTA